MLKMDQVHVLRHNKPQHGNEVSGSARAAEKFSASARAAGVGSGKAAARGACRPDSLRRRAVDDAASW